MHDATIRVSCEDTGILRLTQPFVLSAQLAVFLFKLQNPRDTGQIDTFILAEPLRLNQPVDVAQRIAPGAAFRTLRRDQPQSVVLPERLRVHVRELRGMPDGEQRHVDIETHIVRAIEVGTAFDQRYRAHVIQRAHLWCHPCHDSSLHHESVCAARIATHRHISMSTSQRPSASLSTKSPVAESNSFAACLMPRPGFDGT